jgi:hypothetical protein
VDAIGVPVLTTLQALIESGWLVSHALFLDELKQQAQHEPPPRTGTVAIVTRNRPRLLLRCIQSILENRRRYGRNYRILVSDDADDPRQGMEIAGALARLGSHYNAPIDYAGPAERGRFAAELAAAADVDPATIAFGFGSEPRGGLSTHGANMNSVLAETAGEIVLRCDDDIVCSVGPVPGAAPELVVGAPADPTAIRFFPDIDSVKASVKWEETDLASLHETVLGRTLGDVAADGRYRAVRIETLTARLRGAVARNRGRLRVALVARLALRGRGRAPGTL